MQIIISRYFKKQIKPFVKKYKNLINDIIKELNNFNKNNAIHLGSYVYKIRLKLSDLKKGKSHAFRLIILLIETDKILTPIAIYFKGEKENIAKKEIIYHEKIVIQELRNLLAKNI